MAPLRGENEFQPRPENAILGRNNFPRKPPGQFYTTVAPTPGFRALVVRGLIFWLIELGDEAAKSKLLVKKKEKLPDWSIS